MRIPTLFSILASFSLQATAQAAGGPFLVVIDPGHGGADHGTVYREGGRSVSEKELTLRIAMAVAQELRARGMRAVLTREEDRDVPLSERTALANRLGADVFLSLHMNSSAASRHGQASGVETYILNTSSDQGSKRLADLENAVLTGSVARGLETPEVSLIVKDLLLDGNMAESKRLACSLQGHLVRGTEPARASRPVREARNRGVRQALFYVLLGADMPSALVETGFLDSAEDRRLAASPEGRSRIARSVAEAMTQFRAPRGSRLARASALSTCLVR